MTRPAAILAALALVASTALATVYARLDLAAQTEKADVIVHTLISSVTTEDRGGRTWTVYTLQPQRFLKGEAAGLPQTQGSPSFAVLGGNNLRVEGAPTFAERDEAVLFLYAKGYDSPIVGFRQGAYKIAQGGRLTDLDGKPVTEPQGGKAVELTLDTFLRRVEGLVTGR